MSKLAYLAGLFDGEGTIGMYPAKGRVPRLTIRFVNLHAGSVRMFQRAWGGHVWLRPAAPPCRAAWSWLVADRRAKGALFDLLPYLTIKNREAVVALSVPSTHTGIALSDNQRALRFSAAARLKQLKREVV